jgi:hypothetical protein
MKKLLPEPHARKTPIDSGVCVVRGDELRERLNLAIDIDKITAFGRIGVELQQRDRRGEPRVRLPEHILGWVVLAKVVGEHR